MCTNLCRQLFSQSLLLLLFIHSSEKRKIKRIERVHFTLCHLLVILFILCCYSCFDRILVGIVLHFFSKQKNTISKTIVSPTEIFYAIIANSKTKQKREKQISQNRAKPFCFAFLLLVLYSIKANRKLKRKHLRQYYV